jgi:hypothetical protein
MLQRNVSGVQRQFPLLNPPVTVGHGETLDFPTLIPGFEEVVEEDKVEEPVEPKGPRQRKEQS